MLLPIKVMGDYEEVKDILYSLPVVENKGYVYLIVCDCFLIKVGHTKNIIARMKQHEHGLKCYGFNKIRDIIVTQPTTKYKELEDAILASFDNTFQNCKIMNEWYKTSQYQKATYTFTRVLEKYEFSAVTLFKNTLDYLLELIQERLALHPNDSELVLSADFLMDELEKKNGKMFANRKKSLKSISLLAQRNKEFIRHTSDHRFIVKREILESELIYKQTATDLDYYKNITKISANWRDDLESENDDEEMEAEDL